MKTRKIKKAEIVWDSIAGFFALAGLFFGVISFINRYLDSGNWISKVEDALAGFFKWNVGLAVWALILLLIGLAIYLIVTLYYAKKVDISTEKSLRRAQRLSAALDDQEVVTVEETSEKVSE
ncbi:MAG: hypothetical protein LKF54_03145 [Bacilli bacterium]|jgi:Ca2+/Na+ antiporter|nr:hypothetical protein [Bacilli bacterium]